MNNLKSTSRRSVVHLSFMVPAEMMEALDAQIARAPFRSLNRSTLVRRYMQEGLDRDAILRPGEIATRCTARRAAPQIGA